MDTFSGCRSPRPQGGRCDIGAVETRYANVVNNTGDGAADATRCANPAASTCRLRDAIAATADAGGTITFDAAAFPPAGPARTIPLDPAQGQLTLLQNITITGPGANLLTVSGGCMGCQPGGTPSGGVRVFQVKDGVTATLSGLTITGGNAGDANGGGILSDGTLTLTEAAVTNSVAGQGGGGIYQRGNGTLTLTDVTLSGNTASGGGGISVISSALVATNVTVSGNTGSNVGGGILISGADPGGTGTLTNVTVSGNSAPYGGGIFKNYLTLNATRSIIAGNTGGDLAYSGINGTNTNNLTTGDPLLAPLANYGGPTQTRPPLPGSPALNTGGGCSGTDQRGVPARSAPPATSGRWRSAATPSPPRAARGRQRR